MFGSRHYELAPFFDLNYLMPNQILLGLKFDLFVPSAFDLSHSFSNCWYNYFLSNTTDLWPIKASQMVYVDNCLSLINLFM